jgi:hypothetical protein
MSSQARMRSSPSHDVFRDGNVRGSSKLISSNVQSSRPKLQVPQVITMLSGELSPPGNEGPRDQTVAKDKENQDAPFPPYDPMAQHQDIASVAPFESPLLSMALHKIHNGDHIDPALVALWLRSASGMVRDVPLEFSVLGIFFSYGGPDRI